jgi:hypothetical protein
VLLSTLTNLCSDFSSLKFSYFISIVIPKPMIWQGVETGTTEIAASSDKGAKITTGGGFSRYFAQPSYQKDSIDTYFTNAAKAGQTPVTGYNAAGRGLPDVSLAGSYYAVYIGGTLTPLSGTSASAPVFAGMLSNINAARIAAGKGSMGWANPAVYANSAQFVNDITSGNNKCAAVNSADVVNCCDQGFYATTGWDPVTGLGSINYGKMETAFLSLGDVNAATTAPTQSPVKPSTKPTASPSISPTASPSISPTASPSISPTASPSISPVNLPSISPTASPSISPTASPSISPVNTPSISPTASPSISPTASPSLSPVNTPSISPTASPSLSPTASPSISPTASPSISPTASPTGQPTTAPQRSPLSLSSSPSRSSKDEPIEVPFSLLSSSSPSLPIQGLTQTGDSYRRFQCESSMT